MWWGRSSKRVLVERYLGEKGVNGKESCGKELWEVIRAG